MYKLNKRVELYLSINASLKDIVQYVIKIYKKRKKLYSKGRLLVSRIVELAPFLIILTRITGMKPRDLLDSIVHS